MTMSEEPQARLERMRESLSDLFQDAQFEVENLEQNNLPLDDRVAAECSAFTFTFNMVCGCAGVFGGLGSPAAAANGSMDSQITERCLEHSDSAHDVTIYAAVMLAFGQAMGLSV